MKNLIQYITEHQEFISEYCDMLDQINLEIITEAFNCKLLKELLDQQCDLFDKWKDSEAASRYGSFTKPFDITHVFKHYSHVLWDKIKDEDVQTFKGADTEGLKLFKRICSNRSNSLEGLIIIETSPNENTNNKFSGIILKEYSTIKYFPCSSYRNDRILKPTEATTLLTSDTIYHIVVFDGNPDFNSNRDKIRMERGSARRGMIDSHDPEELKRLAEQNRERYRKLAAKMKIEKQANDDMPDKVNECVDKVMKLAIEFAKNPVKYSKFQYEIGKLMELVGDKEVGYYDRGKYHKYGINGLMYYFSSYLKKKLSLGTGEAYRSDQSEYDSARKKLQEMIDKINNSYNDITKKVSEQKEV